MKQENNSRGVILGSRKSALKGAIAVGKIDAGERIEVSVRVRSRHKWAGTSECGAFCVTPPTRRKHLSHEDFAARYGADPADFERLEQFANKCNLEVVSSHAGQRTLRLAGTVEAMEAAFGVKLKFAMFWPVAEHLEAIRS